MYTITPMNNEDYDEYYVINFQFPKSTARVVAGVDLQGRYIHVISETPGYNWLHYWLAHEPYAKETLNYDKYLADDLRSETRDYFSTLGLKWEWEDKDAAYIFYQPDNFTALQVVQMLGFLLEPRFWIRDKNLKDS